jgi:hypothetical protein
VWVLNKGFFLGGFGFPHNQPNPDLPLHPARRRVQVHYPEPVSKATQTLLSIRRGSVFTSPLKDSDQCFSEI